MRSIKLEWFGGSTKISYCFQICIQCVYSLSDSKFECVHSKSQSESLKSTKRFLITQFTRDDHRNLLITMKYAAPLLIALATVQAAADQDLVRGRSVSVEQNGEQHGEAERELNARGKGKGKGMMSKSTKSSKSSKSKSSKSGKGKGKGKGKCVNGSFGVYKMHVNRSHFACTIAPGGGRVDDHPRMEEPTKSPVKAPTKEPTKAPISAPVGGHKSIPLGNLRPEGIQKGPGSTVFVSQITYGGISSVDVKTSEIQQVVPKSDFLERGALAVGYTGDAFIVPGGGPVPFGFSQTAVYVYDAKSGDDIVTCFPFVGNDGFMNDIAILDEKAYITDSGTPNLMVLNVNKAVNEGICDVSSIALPTEFFDIDFPGANGIAAYGDGLLIGTTSTSAIYFLNLKDESVVEIIAPGGATSPNGLFVTDDRLYITQLNNFISVWNLSGGSDGKPVKAVKEGELTSPLYRSSAVSTIIDEYIYTTNLRLDIGLPAPGEEHLSTFEEDFDIVIVRNIFDN